MRASSISLTTDSVLAHTGESYVGVTGHWIDSQPSPVVGKFSWKLVSAVLAVKVDNESHTAENIAALLTDCVNVKYQLGTRLDSVTTDNGANFRAAVNQLLEQNIVEEDPSCACHTFNLVVKNALDPKVPDSLTSDLVHLFCTITSNIRNSPQRLECLKQLQREKMKSDKELLELCSDDVLPDLEGKHDHSVALTVIKDVFT